jgi:hypothetical protein
VFEIVANCFPNPFRKRNESNLQKTMAAPKPRPDVSDLRYSIERLCGFRFKRRDPVTVGQVIQLSEGGTSPERIVQTMRDSGTVYALSAANWRSCMISASPLRSSDYMSRPISRQSDASKAEQTRTLDTCRVLTSGKPKFEDAEFLNACR